MWCISLFLVIPSWVKLKENYLGGWKRRRERGKEGGRGERPRKRERDCIEGKICYLDKATLHYCLL